jgi:hypothetical protein
MTFWAWNRRSEGERYSRRQSGHGGNAASAVRARSNGTEVKVVNLGPHAEQPEST